MDTEAMISKIKRWMEDGEKEMRVEVLLDSDDRGWLGLKEFRENGSLVALVHSGDSLNSFAPESNVELICEKSALKAVRRRKDPFAGLRSNGDSATEPFPP